MLKMNIKLGGSSALMALAFYTASKFLFASDVEEARDYLVNQGYEDIMVGGTAILNCGILPPYDDYFSTSFRAVSPSSGKVVSGGVCSGFFKGNVARIDS